MLPVQQNFSNKSVKSFVFCVSSDRKLLEKKTNAWFNQWHILLELFIAVECIYHCHHHHRERAVLQLCSREMC